jgi:hypothetical protein
MNQVSLIVRDQKNLTVQATGLRGVTGSCELRSGKPTLKCCHSVMFDYSQVMVGHNGQNFLFGNRQGWVTNIVRHEKIRQRDQKMEAGVCIFIIRPDDQISRITLCHSQMMVEGMDNAVLGLWQIIALQEAGRSGEIILPRLLIATDNRIETLKIH